MTYRREAAVRVAYFSAAAVIAAASGAAAALLLVLLFPGTNHNTHGNLAWWGCVIIFAAVCGLLVYRIDQKLDKRFNKNP